MRLGHRFRGHSDTEVLLHAYAQYGSDCLQKLNGIFAFAVWEERRKRLFLARDRIGVKPLFYKLHSGGLLFASEIKTILAYPTVQARLGESGAMQLLLLGPGRLPGSGILEGIRELEPGYWGFFEGHQLRLERYWKLTDREHTHSFMETSDYVRYLVTDAIKRQIVSDVPIGTFLSGGLDSSIISAVCGKALAERGEVLKTFSVDYLNNDRFFQANRFQPDSDNAYIRIMADAIGSDHQRCVLTPEDLTDAMEDATLARDLPGMADVDISLLVFSGQIRRSVTVALSGECADEIFGGYPWYRDPEIRERAGFPWAQNTRLRSALLTFGTPEAAEAFVMDAYRQTCLESDVLPGTSDRERRMKEMVNLNFRWFMQTLLDRKDRMSMYHGLEVRVPFCDYRIAEYLYGVPWEMKDYQGREKGLLRHAVRDLLPEPVLNRKKSPYPKTYDPRYEQLVCQKLRDLLQTDSPLWHLVRKEQARVLLEQDAPWPWYGQLMRRPQTMMYLLQTDFWLKHYRIDFCF
jgi:asparagine synthase (glutamine-hydrolysing)